MTYSFLNKNNFDKLKKVLLISVILFLTNSCMFWRKEDPVAKYNRQFLRQNKKEVVKKRDIHKKIASKNNIYYDKKLNAMHDIDDNREKVRDELNRRFLSRYKENILEKENDEGVVYATKNLEARNSKQTYSINYDKYYFIDKKDLVKKKFNQIDYATMQINYDYIVMIKDLIKNQEKIRNQNKTTVLEEKVEDGKIKEKVNSIKNKFINLFKK